MAADQERADRIRQVRTDKHLRWKQIAAYVGVEMRSAQMWQETGAISWDNAQKLAELAEVDPHWLMSGVDSKTPDLLDGALAGDSAIEERLAQLTDQLAADRQDREANIAEVKALIQTQNANLKAQTKILKRIEAAVRREDQATRRHDDSAAALSEGVTQARKVLSELQSAAQRPPRAAKAPAKTRTPPASNPGSA